MLWYPGRKCKKVYYDARFAYNNLAIKLIISILLIKSLVEPLGILDKLSTLYVFIM